MKNYLAGFILLFTMIFPAHQTFGFESECRGNNLNRGKQVDKTIFVYGNGMEKAFIKYVAKLTEKRNPTICFVTTAAADNPMVIKYLEELVSDMSIRPKFLISFIVSSPKQESFEEIILNSDAIMVGGGNTLNMLGIWKAQGIDKILRQAYNRGIILAGGSAGSLCWFNGGYTDSRPRELTIMKCLGFLDYSHCPHYNGEQKDRKPLYKKAILEGDLNPGFACDERSGILFINGKMVKSVSLDSKNHSYYVSVKNGKIKEERLKTELIR